MKFFASSSLFLVLLVGSSAVSAAHLKQTTRQDIVARQNLGPVALAARASPSARLNSNSNNNNNNNNGGSNAQHGNPHGNQNSHNNNENGHH
ncbi:hypothetical protein BDY24DRAFT_418205 [Mrakia frigida]|uniref:uncharacterized protein n=1 Tax=Mrakia frigida TaxID=29902 RepID=UPI003FCC02D2